MTYKQFREAVQARARKAGLAEYDLYYQRSASTTVKAYQGEIDEFSDKTSVGACFRCIVDGRTGYSHTQLLSEEEAERLVRDAAACAAVLEDTGFAAICSGGGAYEDVPDSTETDCDVEKLRAMALDIERMAKESDRRILSVPYAYARFAYTQTCLASSHGLDLRGAQSGYTLFCEAIAEQDGRKYAGFSGQERIGADSLDLPALVGEAVSLAVGSIGGESVPSGMYPVLFSNRTMCELLACFASVFSGDAAQKGLSLLAGKEGEVIASPLVTLADDPHRPDSPRRTAFDGEGVPTRYTPVVSAGRLETLLYDMKSAAKAGKASTGNGRRASYAGDVNVAAHNLCLTPGTASLEELVSGLSRGLHITELKGLHASANASTGDFSLESKGRLIEDGRLSRPAAQFTVAGNFYQLLRDVSAVAGDFLLEDGFGAPSVLVKGLSVAG